MGRANEPRPAVSQDPPDEWDVEFVEYEPGGTEEQAQKLRTAWITAMRRHHERISGKASRYDSDVQWDGGFKTSSRRTYQPVWGKLVDRADDLGFDAIYLVRVLFDSITGINAPTPHAIVGAENVQRAKRRAPEEETAVMVSADAESAVFRSSLWAAKRTILDPDPRAPTRHVLNDMGRDLSPLFRYSMALAAGYTDIADRWRGSAMDQFAQTPTAYLKFWAHLLPPELLDPSPLKTGGTHRGQ